MGKMPGKPLNVYLVPADGGPSEAVFPEDRNQADPSWSPDGSPLAFASIDQLGYEDPSTMEIRQIDVRTRRVTSLPDSRGLYSPRWSPDGRHLIAMSVGGARLMLFDVAAGTWEELSEGDFAYPTCSPDGKSISAVRDYLKHPTAIRFRLSDRKIEQVADLASVRFAVGDYGWWSGLAPDGSFLALRNTGTYEIFALEWQAP